MLFNSLEYLIFFPSVVLLYFTLPVRSRNLFLLFASYLFYAYWKVGYLALILISTFVDYAAGILIERTDDRVRRRTALLISLAANLGLLFAFKYFNFFSASLGTMLGWAGVGARLPQLDILLPVGISFYTFQTLSYTIDVYRGSRKAERDLGVLALYVSFFPQLVAGPIERSTRLLPQFHNRRPFSYAGAVSGLRLILWGLFKKVVVADRLGILVDAVYGHPEGYPGPLLVVATLFFAFQILCDFSGYSDIAIGSARILGYDLMTNFKAPYLSASIGEFWSRWHISLSTWFRDYLYIPLGGNRVGRGRHLFNVMAVFLLSGLWHGANWTFLFWGGLHGIYLILEILSGSKGKERSLLKICTTFLQVNIAWVFFRASSLPEAFDILARSFGDLAAWGDPARLLSLLPDSFSQGDFLLSLLWILVLLVVEHRTEGHRLADWLADQPTLARWGFYYAVSVAILVFGVFGANQFIYFQF